MNNASKKITWTNVEYFECKKYLLLRNAFCASIVIASASSKIINLNPDLKIVLVLAKVKICPLTIPIPLSSDALSSKTLKMNNVIMKHFVANFLPLRKTVQVYRVVLLKQEWYSFFLFLVGHKIINVELDLL